MPVREGRKLVILGGGIASLTTAFYASDPRYKSQFPGGIHLYEKSGMLGGKGASMRSSSARIQNRIEEHGLHVWFGSYDNAFALLRQCHEYLDKVADTQPRWSTALRTIDDGFRPCSHVAVMDHDGAEWIPWVADFPDDAARPWLARADNEGVFSPSAIAARALRLAEALLYSLVGTTTVPSRPRSTWINPALLPIPIQLPGTASTIDGLARLLLAPRRDAGGIEVLSRALQLLSRLAREIRNRLDEPVRRHSGTRRLWYMIDLLLAAVRGLIDHGVLHTNRRELIDRFDLRQWLVLNGASEESASCSLVKSLVYDLAFAYEDGDPAKPRCSASVGVFGLFRLLLTYRGAVMWKMNAGMGEIVFAPIYEALLKRDVEFHFDHQLTAVEFDETKTKVSRLHFSAPKTERSRALETLQVAHGPLVGELPYWSASKASAPTREKLVEIVDDDRVVYGLPVGTLSKLMDEAPEPWRNCGRHLKTVGTAALQLWLRAPVSRYAPWATPDITTGAYTEPFDTWADMKVLAGEEARQGYPPIASVAYFTNIIPPETSEKPAVRRFIERDLKGLWPGFESDMIIDQFSRANSDDESSRYTLSLPGTLKFRLWPHDDSIRNVTPVGDWTRNSISAGCIEAAVISGMLGAEAILDDCRLDIVGEDSQREGGGT